MRSFIFAVLACLVVVCGHAADTKLYVGPDGNQAMSGRYWLIVMHADGSAPTVTLAMDTTGTGPIPPPPPPPPPVNDLAAKVTALLAGVTDADKATTAGKIGEAYSLAAMLGELDSNRNADKIRESAKAIITYYLDSKGKSAAWESFTSGMVALTAPLNAMEVIAAYKLTASLLGGGPNPPPPPPPPVTTAVKAALLIESDSQTAEQATLINQWRNDKSWSKLLLVLDPQQKSETGQPDPQTQSLLQSIASRPLPRLVLLDAAGGYVGDEALPSTWDAAKAVLTAKGVVPR